MSCGRRKMCIRDRSFQLRELLGLHLLSAECEAEIYDEFAALARFTFNRNGAAHHIHNVLGDGHAQTGTLNAADGGAFLPAERLKIGRAHV